MLALVPELLPAFAPFDLLAQVFGDFQPDGFQRIVARGGVDVRARHGQMHLRAEGGRIVSLVFQHHFGGGDGHKAAQAFELLCKPGAQVGGGVEATNSELDFHKRVFGVFNMR